MNLYKAAVYVRISVAESNNGIDSTSITNQKNIIIDYCKNNSFDIYDYYIDDGYSGGNFDRPEFNRMLNDIDNKCINMVITKDISRLGRDFIGTGNFIYKYFPEHNIRYIAILDNYDSLNPSLSDDMIPFKTVLNDMYLKDISNKIKSSRHELMKKGLFMGSTVPYGYKRSVSDSRILEIDDYASLIVKRIFTMKDSGYSVNEIATVLTNEQIPPPNIYNNRGKSTKLNWTNSSINYILHNSVYLGTLIQKKYERVSLKSKKKRLLNKDEWICVENNHPAIINENIFNRVNRKEGFIRHKKYNILLKGIVKCNECGLPMFVRKTRSGFIFCCKSYAKNQSVCSMHYFREDVLNKCVMEILFNIIKHFNIKNIVDRLVKSYVMSFREDNIINNISDSIKVDDNVLESLYIDMVKGILSKNDYLNIKRRVEEEKNKKQKKLRDLNLNMDRILIKSDEIVNDFIKLNCKDTLNKLIDKITIDENKKIKIYFRFKYL